MMTYWIDFITAITISAMINNRNHQHYRQGQRTFAIVTHALYSPTEESISHVINGFTKSLDTPQSVAFLREPNDTSAVSAQTDVFLYICHLAWWPGWL
jgi:hypothetical protein